MMDREEAIEFMNELETVILEHPIIDEWWKEVHNRRLAEGLVDTDTPQTESTGSPIGDYRDGVGAWQTDCPWK